MPVSATLMSAVAGIRPGRSAEPPDSGAASGRSPPHAEWQPPGDIPPPTRPTEVPDLPAEQPPPRPDELPEREPDELPSTE